MATELTDQIKSDVTDLTDMLTSSMTVMQKNAYSKFIMFPKCFQFIDDAKFVQSITLWYTLFVNISGLSDDAIDMSHSDDFDKIRRIKDLIVSSKDM